LTKLEQDILQKYDDNYFNNLYSLLDNNVDTQELSNFLLNNFGEYEYNALNDVLSYINQASSLKQQTRGRAKIDVYFYMTVSMFIGFVGGGITL